MPSLCIYFRQHPFSGVFFTGWRSHRGSPLSVVVLIGIINRSLQNAASSTLTISLFFLSVFLTDLNVSWKIRGDIVETTGQVSKIHLSSLRDEFQNPTVIMSLHVLPLYCLSKVWANSYFLSWPRFSTPSCSSWKYSLCRPWKFLVDLAIPQLAWQDMFHPCHPKKLTSISS